MAFTKTKSVGSQEKYSVCYFSTYQRSKNNFLNLTLSFGLNTIANLTDSRWNRKKKHTSGTLVCHHQTANNTGQVLIHCVSFITILISYH